MKNKKFLVLLLVMSIIVAVFAGCAPSDKASRDDKPQVTTTPSDTTDKVTPTKKADPTKAPEPKSETPLVVGYAAFSEKFSPFLQPQLMTERF